jgi:DNA-directed RNA polymerase subunit M/transcription elongation factor TFIIS
MRDESIKPLKRYQRFCRKCGQIFTTWRRKRPAASLICPDCKIKSKKGAIKKLHQYVERMRKERENELDK